MCILCGGQCGGAGEFLISLGLPFLVLYFFRIKKALIKLKNRIISKDSGAEKIQDEIIKYRCCGEWPSTCLKKLDTIGLRSRTNKTIILSNSITKFNNLQALVQKSCPRGVNGWLMLLCLNLTIFIPASCIYEVNCIFDLFNSTKNKILLAILKPLLLYNIIIFVSMVCLAIFSFYAGLRLWEAKQRAVKIAKAFLITQFSLTFIIVIIRPFMTLSLGGNEDIVAEIMKRLLPSLLNFSLWYLYLSHSRRVLNTYSEAEIKCANIRQLPVKLEGHTELT